ncbi:methyltransferase [Hyphodiscus hymeniophilus]|uniref:Methyltransferase n=1 Tax=Hyphodiscus hymeniophilus TaxID=353542 RepID=A0A9P7AYN0_9HELO|nr:methyltransferase [Hyphodiscus hymeniophilus]
MGRGETNKLKRKRRSEAKEEPNGFPHPPPPSSPKTTEIDTSRPTAVFKPTKGREWTVSVALPGSIIANAQSHELRTSMAGHIARALSVFCVDEVIVFSDGHAPPPSRHHHRNNSFAHTPDSGDSSYTGANDPDHFLVHLLSYLETPPHLRRLLFPLHPNLRTAGTLPSLDLPHHLRSDEWCPYREGVTLAEKVTGGQGTKVEAGLRIPVTVEDEIPANSRVTLKLDENAGNANSNLDEKVIHGEAVAPDEPREEGGYYWGYNVRKAANLSDVFTECAFEGGYDMTIGTSERGVDLEVLYGEDEQQKVEGFNHLLVVFGGVAGLEVAVKNDAELQKLGVLEAKDVFDRWVNVCPGQGSRTIRTEEAVWIGLKGLRRLAVNNK